MVPISLCQLCLPFEMERLVVVLEDVDNTRETAFHGPLTDLDSPSECRRKFSREVSWPGDLHAHQIGKSNMI